MAQTRSNMYSFEVYCYRIPIILTFDLDVADFEKSVAGSDWLRSNCAVVEVGTPLFLS